MRTTHLTFVSAAAMSISAAFVYWVTPAGGVASVARADVELAPAAMLEPDSDWFRSEAGSQPAVPTAAPTIIVTNEPVAIAPQPPRLEDFLAQAAKESKVAPVVHRAPKAAPSFDEPRAAAKVPASTPSAPRRAAFAQPPPAFAQHKAAPPPPPRQAPPPQPTQTPQRVAVPVSAAPPASTGFPQQAALPPPSSTSFK